jgi:hypothetical protein
VVHDWASSTPDAPPKETTIDPPAARSAATRSRTPWSVTASTPPHAGVHAAVPVTTNAIVNARGPDAAEMAARSGVGHNVMSTYGAKRGGPEPTGTVVVVPGIVVVGPVVTVVVGPVVVGPVVVGPVVVGVEVLADVEEVGIVTQRQVVPPIVQPAGSDRAPVSVAT